MKKAKNMSPLLLVGILFSAVVADVSHVLSGSAHPPADANEVNQLAYAKTAFQTGNPQDFWWMASNSPLKQAYDYFKKCSSKGDCLPPANAVGEASGDAKGAAAGADIGPIDLKSNPFLNGAYQSGGVSSSAAFAPSSSSGAGSSSSSGGCSVCASGGGAQAGGVAAFHSGTKIDIAGNPFLNGQFAFASNGEKVKDENGFLGVQPKKPGFATSHPLSNKKPFATSPPVGQQSFVLGGGEIEGIACQGHGAICVAKEQCVNGVVDKKDVFQVKNDVQHCDAETEVCCRLASASGGSSSKAGFTGLVGKGNLPANINDLVEVSAGKSSVTGSPLKFSGGVGTSPGQIQVLTDQSPDGKLCHGGESGNTNKPVRDISVSGSSGNLFPTADYSNVQFDSNVRFASSIQGPAYLPPIELSPSTPTTSPSLCPAGTFLAPSGRCEGRKVETCPPGTTKIPDGTCEPRAPTCPPGTALTPFGSCEVPKKPAPVCPSGTVKLPDGSCATPTPKQCPPGTFLTASGSCQPPATPISCPFGTKQRPDGTCESPTSPIPCPAGTILGASGSCEPTTVQRCPFGTIQTPDGSCESPPTTPRPCPPGTTRTVSGSCEAIKTPSCPFGTILRPDGSCGSINPPTTPKPCPPGTILTASGLCEAVVSPTPGCPFGTIQRPDGSCETRSTPAPPRPCPPGTIRTGSGLCEAVVSPTPGCPFGTIQKPDGSCETRSTPAPPRPCPPGTIRTGSGLCEAIVSPTPGCPFGTIQRPDGSCETRTTPAPPRPCPPGTIRTGSGLCEAVVSPTPGCPFGTIQRPDGSCETRTTPAPPRPCPPGTIRTGSGLCEAVVSPTPGCPFGTIQRPDGSCETRTTPAPPRPCPPGTIRTGSGLCEAVVSPTPGCPFGTIQRPDGSCETRTTPAPPRPCPPGTIRTGSGLCEAIVSPTPGCPFGTIQRPDGSCETRSTPAPPRPCPPGTIRTGSGLCEALRTISCPFGTVQRPDGSCEARTPPPVIQKCPPGTVLTASGLCEATRISISCPFGTIQRPDGTCEQPPIVSSTPRPCPTGTFLTSSGLCESPVTPSPTTPGYTYPKPCPPGTFKTPAGLCETPIVTTPRPQCPFGTYLTPSGSCETPRPTSPKPPPSTTASREYLPPVTPTQPPVTYVYNTPTPTFSYPSRSPTPSVVPGSTIPPGSSIPEEPDKVDQGTNIESIKIATNPPPTSPPNRPNINVEQNNSPPVGCAAALKCVQEIYCTAEGFVSPVPVVLTKEQELLRAPTTECKDLETGIIGKCCRDLNYKDPWPSANLVNGVDNGQYKEDNFYGQSELLGSNRLTRSFNATGGDRPRVRTSVVSINAEDDHTNCGERHHDTKPLGEGPIDAKFAEYPWQAMILRDSNRSLLCGGAIIRKNAVLTTAHCVEGLETSDVLIKGGEWKLGIDEEPLPFQIVKVAAILRHPGYKPGSYENDLAVLVLHEKLRMTKNVGTICLPQPNQAPAPASKCVVTGWGKRILQLHAKGAIMHHIDVALMDGQECQQTLTQKSQNALQLYNPTTLCGVSNADHCKVDYGSALACSDDQQHYTLHGIYTWDTGCGQDGQVGGYITPDIEWIDSIMARPLKQLKRIEKEYLLNKG